MIYGMIPCRIYRILTGQQKKMVGKKIKMERGIKIYDSFKKVDEQEEVYQIKHKEEKNSAPFE